MEPVEPSRVIFLDIVFPPKLSKSAIEHSDDDHRDEGCDEHDAVKAVQDAAVAGEDGAVVR